MKNSEELLKKYFETMYNLPLFNIIVNGVVISDVSHKQCNQIMAAIIEGERKKKKEDK